MTDQSTDPSLAPPEHSRAGTMSATAFLVFSTVIAIGFIVIAGVRLYEQRDALSNWLTTEGMVSETSLDRVPSGAASSAGANSGDSYIPVIRYFYNVDGMDHVGTRATPLNSAGTLGWASELVRDRHYGDPLMVYYNPDEPSESFVVRYWEDTLVLVAMFASSIPCFIAFLVTAGGMRKYALKWMLPAAATTVFAIGFAVSAGMYFRTVPRADQTGRADVAFATAGGLVVLSMMLTLVWRNQHMAWRRTNGTGSPRG